MVGRDLKAPGHFTLVLRGNRSWGFATTTGVDRPDVVAALHAPAATQAGFNRLVDIRTVPPGSYAVLGLIERGADSQLCDMHRQLTIGGLGAP